MADGDEASHGVTQEEDGKPGVAFADERQGRVHVVEPAQVARALGFPSVAVFAYRFRNATGTSPEQFAQGLNRTRPGRPASAPRAAHARMPQS